MSHWAYSDTIKDLWKVYRLQAYEKDFFAIKSEMDSLDPGKEFELRRNEVLENLKIQKEKLENNKKRINLLNLEIKSLDGQVKQIEDRLYGGKTTNSKELAQWQKELANVKKKRGDFDEETLTLMYENESLEEKIKVLNKDFDVVEKDYNETCVVYKEKIRELTLKVEDIEAKQSKIKENLEQELMKVFEEKKAKCGGLAIVLLQRGVCGGCGMALSGRLVERVKSKTSMEFCEHCDRILFWEGEKQQPVNQA